MVFSRVAQFVSKRSQYLLIFTSAAWLGASHESRDDVQLKGLPGSKVLNALDNLEDWSLRYTRIYLV